MVRLHDTWCRKVLCNASLISEVYAIKSFFFHPWQNAVIWLSTKLSIATDNVSQSGALCVSLERALKSQQTNSKPSSQSHHPEASFHSKRSKGSTNRGLDYRPAHSFTIFIWHCSLHSYKGFKAGQALPETERFWFSCHAEAGHRVHGRVLRWIFLETKSLFFPLLTVSVHVFLFFKHCGNPGCLVSYNSRINGLPRGKAVLEATSL